jgi:hypothetical protein
VIRPPDGAREIDATRMRTLRWERVREVRAGNTRFVLGTCRILEMSNATSSTCRYETRPPQIVSLLFLEKDILFSMTNKY